MDDEKTLLFMNQRIAAALNPRPRLRKGPQLGGSAVGAEKPNEMLSGESEESQNPSPADENSPLALSELSVNAIRFSPFQTREFDDRVELEALVESIRTKGVIQPIICRELESAEGGPAYELIAGERRLRAARIAGLPTIPAILQEASDEDAAELSVIENAQRRDLNPIEEALAFQQLHESFHLSHAAIAQISGRNRASVTNSLRLLQLEDEIIDLIKSGELSAGHGKVLLSIDDSALRTRLSRKTAAEGWSVRQLENVIQRLSEKSAGEEPDDEAQRARAQAVRLEAKVGEYLGLDRVKLSVDSEGRKRLSLTFESEAAWKRFMLRIKD